MIERIKDKIKQVEEFLGFLLEIKPSSLEEYIGNEKTKAACERFVQKLIDAIVDLTYIIIREMKLLSPENEEQAFDILQKKGIISIRLCERLKEAKGMRNIIAHEYGEVDDTIVFHSIHEELEKDVNEFIRKIKIFIGKESNEKVKKR